MITSSVIAFILSLFRPIVDLLPTVNLSAVFSSRAAITFLDWVCLAGYLFPFETVLLIFSIIFALQVFRIVISFFKSLWGVLPIF